MTLYSSAESIFRLTTTYGPAKLLNCKNLCSIEPLCFHSNKKLRQYPNNTSYQVPLFISIPRCRICNTAATTAGAKRPSETSITAKPSALAIASSVQAKVWKSMDIARTSMHADSISHRRLGPKDLRVPPRNQCPD